MSAVKVSGVTPATTVADLVAAAMPTTTLKPGTCPANYLKGDYPNPDLSPLYDGRNVGDGYVPTGNEFYYAKLPAALANTSNLIGWPVCVVVDANRALRVTVKGYKKGAPANGISGMSGFDSFQFTPTLPGIFARNPMNFYFAPTMTGGRRRRGSRRSRKGRKGTRRH